jgi:hypothetical protein
LPPGFCSPAADKGLVFGCGSPRPPGGQTLPDDIVKQGCVDLRIEEAIIQFQITYFLISNVINS